jgi:hypothetical protein
MRRHEVSFLVDAAPERVWRMFHPKVPPGATVPRTFEHPGGSITVLNEGNEDGQGLVRTCTFPVPKYLLSGGTARSWELVVEVRKNEYARYEALGKPPWSSAQGWHSLEPLDGGTRTRLTFVEIFHIPNPLMRWLFEGRVHRFISAENTNTYATVLGHLGPVTREK